MTHEMGVTENRMAHEYKNTATGEFEVIRRQGLYDVLETFLTPEGRILLLAYNSHAKQPFVVGIYNSDHGVNWTDLDDARRHYAWRIAESFGLVVDKEGSKAVVPASREYATDIVKTIKEKSGAWLTAAAAEDKSALEQAGDGLESAASSLAKHLQRTGVLTREIYKSWEAVG
ncbi:hypothetical protein ACFRQM_40075 [Streptomyces sp. NPDC056831]|uniref:hypothetical protein n=1 Tax=Streptomyces sp. NPDC056831 TaxID=3345954 RepID=UPI0036880244